MNKNKQLLFVQRAFSPYRMRLFNRLNNEKDIEVKVVYLTKDTGRNWNLLINNANYECAKYYDWNMLSKLKFFKYIFSSSRKNNNQRIIYCTDFNKIITIFFMSILSEKYLLWVTIYDNYKITSSRFINYIGERLSKFIVNHAQEPILSYSSNIKNLCKGKKTIVGSQYYGLSDVYKNKSNNKLKFKGKFLIVSYLNKRKSIHEVTKIFKQYPEFTLTIAGDGDSRYVSSLKKNAPSNVKFIGHVNAKEKAQLFSESNFFIFHTNKDTWGNTIMESFYNELPVIGSKNAMGARDLIRNKHNGFIYSDINDLNEILCSLSNNGIDIYSTMKNNVQNINNDENYFKNVLEFVS